MRTLKNLTVGLLAAIGLVGVLAALGLVCVSVGYKIRDNELGAQCQSAKAFSNGGEQVLCLTTDGLISLLQQDDEYKEQKREEKGVPL